MKKEIYLKTCRTILKQNNCESIVCKDCPFDNTEKCRTEFYIGIVDEKLVANALNYINENNCGK
jgi:hypothetical protein